MDKLLSTRWLASLIISSELLPDVFISLVLLYLMKSVNCLGSAMVNVERMAWLGSPTRTRLP